MQYSVKTSNSEFEVDFIKTMLSRSKRYLEFGSGASTLMASKIKQLKTISIETDPDFISYLSRQLPINYLEEGNSSFLHIDIGRVGDWGWPVDPVDSQKLLTYNFRVWQHLQEIQFNPDLILIDGRFRVSSFVTSIVNSPKTTILFDDYFDRTHYHLVEKLVEPHKRVGRIGVFKSPRFLTRVQMRIAQSLLAEYILDPS
jgi:protein O-GlcNAc transferase